MEAASAAPARARPHPLALVGYTSYVGEDYAAARVAFLAAEQRAPSPYHQYMLACIAAATGDGAAMVLHAGEALRGDVSYAERFERDEEFVPYRGDAAFAAALGLRAAAER